MEKRNGGRRDLGLGLSGKGCFFEGTVFQFRFKAVDFLVYEVNGEFVTRNAGENCKKGYKDEIWDISFHSCETDEEPYH